jgi:hypothetical protein
MKTGLDVINLLQFFGGKSLTASGAIKSPIRSPARAVIVFGASTIRNLPEAALSQGKPSRSGLQH